MFLAPIFLGERPPSFWNFVLHLSQIPIMWQNFAAIGQGTSEMWLPKNITCKTGPSVTVVPGGLIIIKVTRMHLDLDNDWTEGRTKAELQWVGCFNDKKKDRDLPAFGPPQSTPRFCILNFCMPNVSARR